MHPAGDVTANGDIYGDMFLLFSAFFCCIFFIFLCCVFLFPYLCFLLDWICVLFLFLFLFCFVFWFRTRASPGAAVDSAAGSTRG